MGSTWNGNEVPEENDFWNLVRDFRRLAEQNNRIIPVYSEAERDALQGSSGAAVPDGTVVVRLDQSGVFDVRVDGGWLGGDTGWVTMSYGSGFSAGTPGQLAYKVAGNTLHIKGGATGTFGPGAYVQVSSTLIPAQFRPTDTQYFGSVGTAGYAAGIQLSLNGYIQLISRHEPGWISAACSLPLT